jgi:hypothetical protein
MSTYANSRTVLSSGHLMIIDEEKGVGMLCDPPGGFPCTSCGCFHPYWKVTIAFQLKGAQRMQQTPFRVRLGLN